MKGAAGRYPGTDRVIITGLRTRCTIGVWEEERKEKQEVVINLAVETDLRKAAKSDRFEDALDYRALKKRILAFAEQSQFHLLEALAEAIAGLCLEDRRIFRAQVSG